MAANKNTVYFLLVPLGVYCLLLPFEELLSFGKQEEAATLVRYIGMMVGLLFVLNLLTMRTPFRLGPAQVWAILFIGFGCLSYWWSIAPAATLQRMPTSLSLLCFYLAIGLFRTDQKGIDLLGKMIVIGGAAAACAIIYTYHVIGLSFMESHRASIIYGAKAMNPNDLAFSLLLPLSLLLSQLGRKGSFWAWAVRWWALVTIAYAGLITGSRGGMLGMAVIICLFALHKGAKRMRAWAGALIIIATLVILSSDVLLQRATLQNESIEYTRGNIWRTGLTALPDYWLLGAGMDAYPIIYLKHSNQQRSAAGSHSTYIGTLVELGVVGLFFLAVAMLLHYRALRVAHQQSETAFALKAVFLGMLTMATVYDILYLKTFWMVLALTMILSAGAVRLRARGAYISGAFTRIPPRITAGGFGQPPATDPLRTAGNLQGSADMFKRT